MNGLLLAALCVATVAAAGCSDDAGPRLSEEEGACVAQELSQKPPEDDQGRLDEDEIPESCGDDRGRA